MPGGSYERYGLTGNPFRDLTSDSLEDIEVFHVDLQIDESLNTIKDEVLEKENKALVALVGSLGTGKTHRLRLAQAQAKDRGAYCVYLDVPEKAGLTMPLLAHEFQAAKNLKGFAKIFNPPAWYRQLTALEKSKDGKYDPGQAGHVLAAALNMNAPSFLLLNDLQNVAKMPDSDLFVKALQELGDELKPGALVMFGCTPSFLVTLGANYPALSSRINRTFLLPTLSIDEAALLLAKKLLAKRIVQNLDPLYPYDRDAAAALNSAAQANPRRLVELADRALEYAVEHRAYRVDADTVAAAIPPTTTLDTSGAVPKILPQAPPSLASLPATPEIRAKASPR
ncbi:MAG: hypothetical protein L3K09_05800 [Thermoplasmata archaeon]|nr:hypothetical protein [Thermoplasmata archaeon]